MTVVAASITRLGLTRSGLNRSGLKRLGRSGALLVLSALISACGKQGETTMSEKKSVASVWQQLAQKRVLFAHQSVGENILDGVLALAADQNDKLPISKARVVAGPGITHFDVGSNGDPMHKIDDFAATVASAGPVDVAILKLCFWDFNPENPAVDARAVAKAYTDTFDKLAAQYPQTVFVPTTVPLMTVQGGWRASLRSLLGKAPGGFEDNVRRADFNDIVRAHFKNSGRLLDIAKFESVGRGITNTVTANGRTVEVLDPALTNDGGHLNDEGKKLIATEMLLLLDNLTGSGKSR